MSLLGADLASLATELILVGTGLVVLLLGVYLPRLGNQLPCLLGSLGVLVAGLLSWSAHPSSTSISYGGLLESSPLTFFASCIVLLVAFITLLAARSWLEREGVRGGEFPAFLLWATVGCLLVIRADELLTLFLALEILSVSLFSLASLSGRSAAAREAAFKYFFMSAFVGAFSLYGMVLLYGRAGTTHLSEIANSALGGDLLAVLGLILVMAGIFFRMAIVPFHAWLPDVQQGAGTPFVAYLSTAPVVAATVVILRLLHASHALDVGVGWSRAIFFLSLASMVLGHLLALVQQDIKRMLAYACVAQMGYLLIPLVDLGVDSYPAILTQLLAYALMISGSFVVIGLLFERSGEQHAIGELAGWGYRFPLLGFALTISLLSLAGLPPTAGFVARSVIYLHALNHGHLLLAAVGLASSLLGVVYCVRVIYVLYLKTEIAQPGSSKRDIFGTVAAVTAAVLSLLIGIVPGRLLETLGQLMSELP